MEKDIYAKTEKLIYGMARKYMAHYPNFGLSFEDLLQEGWIGALHAYRLYDNKHKSRAKFTTYAYWFIRGNISSYCRKESKKSSYRTHCPLEYGRFHREIESPALEPYEVEAIFNLSDDPEMMRKYYFKEPYPEGKKPDRRKIYRVKQKMIRNYQMRK